MNERTFARGSLGAILAWVAVAILLALWLSAGSLTSAMLSNVKSSGAYKETLALALARVTDSDGHVDSYSHDDQLEMTAITHGSDGSTLTNSHEHGNIQHQSLANGRTFDYRYDQHLQLPNGSPSPVLITDPNANLTHVRCNSAACVQSLPSPAKP